MKRLLLSQVADCADVVSPVKALPDTKGTAFGKLPDGSIIASVDGTREIHNIAVVGNNEPSNIYPFAISYAAQSIRRGESLVYQISRTGDADFVVRLAEDAGYTIKTIDLDYLDASAPFNILSPVIHSTDSMDAHLDALSIATTMTRGFVKGLLGDDSLAARKSEALRSLLSALFQRVALDSDTKPNEKDLSKVMEYLTNKMGVIFFDILFKEISGCDRAEQNNRNGRSSYNAFVSKMGDNLENYNFTSREVVDLAKSFFSSKFMKEFMDVSTLWDPEKWLDFTLPAKEKCLYVVSASGGGYAERTFAASIISSLMTAMARFSLNRDEHASPVHVTFVLTDMTYLGYICDLNSAMKRAEQSNISFCLGIHDMSAMSSLYGSEWDEVMDSFFFSVFLGNSVLSRRIETYFLEQVQTGWAFPFKGAQSVPLTDAQRPGPDDEFLLIRGKGLLMLNKLLATTTASAV